MKKANRLTENRSERKKTEKNYFEGIKNIIPDSLKNDLQIKIYSNKALSKIIDFAAEERNKDERFRDIWLVFDRDEVKNFDELIGEAKENKMNVAWSNPCFEIWLMSYFKNLENIPTSKKCCENFEKESEEKIYNILCENGNENKAIQRAREKYHQVREDYSQPSKMIGCTTVYKLVEELKRKMRGEYD